MIKFTISNWYKVITCSCVDFMPLHFSIPEKVRNAVVDKESGENIYLKSKYLGNIMKKGKKSGLDC